MNRSHEQLLQSLNKHLKIKLDLLINNNCSTMLSLLEKRRGYARLSLHQMFLYAPEEVIAAIAHYVRGTRKDRPFQNLILRGYIQKNLSLYDNSHRVNKQKLTFQITWYGVSGRKKRTRLIFGQYNETLKLVKIHRVLDDPFFPDYFVSFIVYHEMLHGVVPGHIDEKGWYRTHTKLFKEKERNFMQYRVASEWEKKNKKYIFGAN